MRKPLFILPGVLLIFAVPAQEPVATPAAVQQPVATAPAVLIPADAAKMVNPLKPTPESLAKAKKVYGYDCAMCHGAAGDGKGELVSDMKLTLQDFTDPASLKDVSDGEMFYVIKNGKGKMIGEGDRAKPDDIWNLVLLLRSFAKKQG